MERPESRGTPTGLNIANGRLYSAAAGLGHAEGLGARPDSSSSQARPGAAGSHSQHARGSGTPPAWGAVNVHRSFSREIDRPYLDRLLQRNLSTGASSVHQSAEGLGLSHGQQRPGSQQGPSPAGVRTSPATGAGLMRPSTTDSASTGRPALGAGASPYLQHPRITGAPTQQRQPSRGGPGASDGRMSATGNRPSAVGQTPASQPPPSAPRQQQAQQNMAGRLLQTYGLAPPGSAHGAQGAFGSGALRGSMGSRSGVRTPGGGAGHTTPRGGPANGHNRVGSAARGALGPGDRRASIPVVVTAGPVVVTRLDGTSQEGGEVLSTESEEDDMEEAVATVSAHIMAPGWRPPSAQRSPSSGVGRPLSGRPPSAMIRPASGMRVSATGGGGGADLGQSMTYDDIPVLDGDGGQDPLDGAPEEVGEPLDTSIAGITLDQYMSSLVTTPASLAATSGLGQRFPGHTHTASQGSSPGMDDILLEAPPLDAQAGMPPPESASSPTGHPEARRSPSFPRGGGGLAAQPPLLSRSDSGSLVSGRPPSANLRSSVPLQQQQQQWVPGGSPSARHGAHGGSMQGSMSAWRSGVASAPMGGHRAGLTLRASSSGEDDAGDIADDEDERESGVRGGGRAPGGGLGGQRRLASQGMSRASAAVAMSNSLDLRPATAAAPSMERRGGDGDSLMGGGRGSRMGLTLHTLDEDGSSLIKEVDLGGLSAALFTPNSAQQAAAAAAAGGGDGSETGSPVPLSRMGSARAAAAAAAAAATAAAAPHSGFLEAWGAGAGGAGEGPGTSSPTRLVTLSVGGGEERSSGGAGGGGMGVVSARPVSARLRSARTGAGGPGGGGGGGGAAGAGSISSSGVLGGGGGGGGGGGVSGSWAQRVGTGDPTGHHQAQGVYNQGQGFNQAAGFNQGPAAAALTGAVEAAAAANSARPQGAPPGGSRMVQSARPLTRGGAEIDPTVWRDYINVQLQRPPSRQKPPPEALHLWSPVEHQLEAGQSPGGLPPGAGGGGMRGRARPQTAMAISSSSRRPLSGPSVKAAPPAHVVMDPRAAGARPPTRQKPPPMSLLAEHQDEFTPSRVHTPSRDGGGGGGGLSPKPGLGGPLGGALGALGGGGGGGAGRSAWSRGGMGSSGAQGFGFQEETVIEGEEGEEEEEGHDPFGGGPGPHDGDDGMDSDEY